MIGIPVFQKNKIAKLHRGTPTFQAKMAASRINKILLRTLVLLRKKKRDYSCDTTHEGYIVKNGILLQMNSNDTVCMYICAVWSVSLLLTI